MKAVKLGELVHLSDIVLPKGVVSVELTLAQTTTCRSPLSSHRVAVSARAANAEE
jgi:hypothetical protein